MHNNFRMSPLGFWVPVGKSRESMEQAPGAPVEGFGEASRQQHYDKRGEHPTSSDPSTGRGTENNYRMSPLGFWVPAREFRNSEDAGRSSMRMLPYH